MVRCSPFSRALLLAMLMCALPGRAADPAKSAKPPASAPAKTPAKAPAAPVETPAPPATTSVPADDPRRTCWDCHTEQGWSGHDIGRKPSEPQGAAKATQPAAGCESCHVVTGPGTTHIAMADVSRQTCEGCHALGAKDKPVKHPPVVREACTACHDPHDRSKRTGHLTKQFSDDVCATCHERVDGMRHPHSAVKLGQCSGCHDPHGSDHPNLLLAATADETCEVCHSKIPEAIAKAAHLPAANAGCSTCHLPHGSDHAGNLKAPAAELCATCHERLDQGKFVHTAVVLGECAECHDPHGSPKVGNPGGSAVAKACYQCHYDDITGRLAVHTPTGTGECGACHDPHSSDHPGGLRMPENELCAMCHPAQTKKEPKTAHQAVRAYGCTACHDPHASDQPFELRKSEIKLCTSCHRGYEDGYHVAQRPAGGGHPMGAGRKDPLRAGRDLTCSSCHDPHGSDNPAMFLTATRKIDLCASCHQDALAPGRRPGTPIVPESTTP